MRRILLAVVAFLGFCRALDAQPAVERSGSSAPRRIVCLGSTVTEFVFALGAGGEVVALDESSRYPPEASALPRVGYHRQVGAEGVLSFEPTLVVATNESGPPEAIAQIKAAGVDVQVVDNLHSPTSTRAMAERIGAVLGKHDEARNLVAALDRRLAFASRLVEPGTPRPKVLFIYARSVGSASVSGTKTAADAMIALAGGENAVGGYEGYKALTAEAMAAADPDVILLPAHGVASLGGADAVATLPGVALTKAGRNGRIVAMDDQLLLGFGPRLGDGVVELSERIHAPAN